ncbi:hypothetical protein ElyMa_004693300 [Elysia marginata]|uniref:Secreted protein n=1 Tax=Elysia marginata TaxID=1093978 RepID=A0AAV4I627_9GAST|nr:hypothetical protein ElyMa_004693300 [Elysia marginata]
MFLFVGWRRVHCLLSQFVAAEIWTGQTGRAECLPSYMFVKNCGACASDGWRSANMVADTTYKVIYFAQENDIERQVVQDGLGSACSL